MHTYSIHSDHESDSDSVQINTDADTQKMAITSKTTNHACALPHPHTPQMRCGVVNRECDYVRVY